MKLIYTLLLLLPLLCSAQDKTPTPEEAKMFFENADVMLGEQQTFYEHDEFYSMYAKRNTGDIIITGSVMYQVLGIECNDTKLRNILF